jgi:predicted site-specific integrase-resolvase
VEKFYSIRQTSELLGIKVRTVREWIRKGKLKAQKYDVSNRWFIAEGEIQRLRNGNEG